MDNNRSFRTLVDRWHQPRSRRLADTDSPFAPHRAPHRWGRTSTPITLAAPPAATLKQRLELERDADTIEAQRAAAAANRAAIDERAGLVDRDDEATGPEAAVTPAAVHESAAFVVASDGAATGTPVGVGTDEPEPTRDRSPSTELVPSSVGAELQTVPPGPAPAERSPRLARLALAGLILSIVGVATWVIVRDSDSTEIAGDTDPGASTPVTPLASDPPPSIVTTLPSGATTATSVPETTTMRTRPDVPPLADPLTAPPTITVGNGVTLQGAVRTEAAARRVRGAAAALAGDSPVEDQLVVDDRAVPWNEARIVVPTAAVFFDGETTDGTGIWLDAVVALVAGPDADVLLRTGPRRSQASRALVAAITERFEDEGFAPISLETSSAGENNQVAVVVRALDG